MLTTYTSIKPKKSRMGSEYWESMVHEWKLSGTKKSDFCRQRGINYHNLMFHCTRMKKKSGIHASEKLVAMKLVAHTPAAIVTSTPAPLCSMTFANNLVLNIYDSAALSVICDRLMPHAVRI